ncbi:hypothetical protein B0H19DRAFT_1265636 [Mycena capillaripes]|nr:hypothetical protein B0H19DRAFT_1265636 [Mycena capillaripes]
MFKLLAILPFLAALVANSVAAPHGGYRGGAGTQAGAGNAAAAGVAVGTQTLRSDPLVGRGLPMFADLCPGMSTPADLGLSPWPMRGWSTFANPSLWRCAYYGRAWSSYVQVVGG